MLRLLTVGQLQANCYIFVCDETGIGVVIDPGDESEKIVNLIQGEAFKILYIINTHVHLDHTGANKEVKRSTGAKILVHQEDADMLEMGRYDLSFAKQEMFVSFTIDRRLVDNEIIKFGMQKLKVIHTPGHTPGGICLLGKDVLFTGDTLFNNSIGRYDLPGGDREALKNSLKKKLLVLDDNLTILPGHGPFSSLGEEKKNNLLLQEITEK